MLVECWARAAAVAVTVMAAAGLLLVAWLLGGLAPLLASACGLMLVAKVALVSIMLGLAARNRLRLTPALATGGPGAGGHLASIRAGAVVALLVLRAVAALTPVSPPSLPHGMDRDMTIPIGRAGAPLKHPQIDQEPLGRLDFTRVLRTRQAEPRAPAEAIGAPTIASRARA